MAPPVAVAGIAARLGVEAVGETIEGIFGLASATVTAAGEAAKGIGSAVGGALQGALSPAPVNVVNNVGMVGQAAKSKVTGSGTLPAPPQAGAKPVVNENMPTEKLLTIAIEYLSSIEDTLRAQINTDRLAAQQQAQAEREAAIEGESNEKPSPFKTLGEKLGGLKDNATDRASMLTKAVLGAGALAGFTLLGLGEMDKTELDALKENWDKFYSQWEGVINLLKPVWENAGWGTFLGYMLFGARGAVAGWLFDYIKNVTGGSDLAAWTAGVTSATAMGVFGKTARALLFRTPLGLAGLATAGIIATVDAGATYTQTTTQNKITTFMANYGLFVEQWSENGLYPVKFKIVIPNRGINITGIPRNQLGESANGRPSDPYYYWYVVNDVAVRSTGGTDMRWGNSTQLKAWLDGPEGKKWLDEHYPLRSDASAVPPAQSSTPDASSTSETSSTTSDATALPPAATGSIDAILDKNPEQLTDAELRQLVEAQGRIEDPNGRTNNPGGILYGTGPLQEHQIGSVGANANSSVRIAVYDTPENGIRAAMENWRNSRYYRGKTVREGLGTWSGGNGAHYARMLGSARPGYEGTTNPQVGVESTGEGLMAAAWDITKGAIEAVSNIIAAGVGPMSATTGSQLSGFDSNMSSRQPGASTAGGGSTATVQGAQDTKTTALANISTTLQNAIELGNTEDAQSQTASDTPGQSSLRGASPDGKLECIDPNYPGTGGIDQYLQYYRLAA